MSKRRPSTNFTILEREFNSIIIEIRDYDSTGQKSSMSFQRKTILLNNDTRVYVTERVVNAEILFYQYDWYTNSGEELLKFHSEEHKDKRYKTATGDHHIHPSSTIKLLNVDRLPNYLHQDLRAIMEFILLHTLANAAKEKNKK
ncbi:toxin-antitoxin system TumE family protein [Paenibacillus periandrae]|uniref:toxin-antitoxin system TumE family protein n=1 Tax=Paenibacillus periandrae TaxID=1761741 RepID=UPI001F090798|nr:DUF6516 family protein [Paenibacillus periandrae]